MKDNQPKPNNALAKATSGTAVEPKKPSSLEALKNMDGSYVEMQDLVPVMSSFQDYLEEEKRKTATRMQTLGLLFLLLIVAFVGAVMFMSQQFVHQSQVHVEQYLAAEKKTSKAVLEGMAALTAASRELREELVRQREQRTAAPAGAPVGDVATEVQREAQPEAVDQPAVPEAKPEETVPVAPVVPAPGVTGEVALAAATNSVAPDVIPVVEPSKPALEPKKQNGREGKVEGVQPDLESLLKQVEQAISEKENELKGRRKN